MQEARDFLESQKLLSIATIDGNQPWIANVYYGVEEDRLYFISPKDTRHSVHMKENSVVAFTTAWYDETDYKNRKAIQGLGTCRVATSDEENIGVMLHNTRFPQFADRITLEWLHDDDNRAVWVITPTYIKYWDDALYGNNGVQEFHF